MNEHNWYAKLIANQFKYCSLFDIGFIRQSELSKGNIFDGYDIRTGYYY